MDKVLNFIKKRKLLTAFIVLFLTANIFLISYFLKWPQFLFPQAEVSYDVTGQWLMTLKITSPISKTLDISSNLVQDQNGKVTGTATIPDGDLMSISGQVTGNHISCDPTSVSTTVGGIHVELTYTMEGTINDTGTQITGTVGGSITKPITATLVGTFTAQRQGSASTSVATSTPVPTFTPLPTVTPVPTVASGTPAPTPTSTPLAAGSTSTPTPTSTGRATATPIAAGYTSTPRPTVAPIPVSGTDWPTLLFATIGLILMLSPLIIFI